MPFSPKRGSGNRSHSIFNAHFLASVGRSLRLVPSGVGLLAKEYFYAKMQLPRKRLNIYPAIPSYFRLDSRLKKYRGIPIRQDEF